MKKIAVVLSGCGHRDGTEITEVVSLMIALHQQGAEPVYFAPNMDVESKNHLTGEKNPQDRRNILLESARIARGQIQDLQKLNARDFDALAFPGGFGAATHLSNWAEKASQCHVHPEVSRVIKEFHSQSKPIAAICIAPTLLAKVLGSQGVELTLGEDKAVAAEINKTGARHINCPVDDYVTDRNCKVITTPAYMQKAKPHEIFKGISGLAKELVEMA